MDCFSTVVGIQYLNILPSAASTSTGVFVPFAGVKNVPIFLPFTIPVIAFSNFPLQTTTETPFSSAQLPAFTYKKTSMAHVNVKILNTCCLPNKAWTNSADQDL